ncbi:MAG: EAL domain-containing protein [Dehalococcoidia bacterium]|nr:EAL domain-containing protein [Dehalococcoidia bacterium]
MSGHTTAGALEATTRQFGLSPERVVLELTEGEKIDDFDRMRRVLGGFRSRGFLIAIDDAGAGQSSLQSVVELRPDYIKLDRWLSRDIEFDRSRRSMVQALVGFAHQVRARVVAEGIETYEQLDAFIDLGVDFGQGYIFGFLPRYPCPHRRKSSFTSARRTQRGAGPPRIPGSSGCATSPASLPRWTRQLPATPFSGCSRRTRISTWWPSSTTKASAGSSPAEGSSNGCPDSLGFLTEAPRAAVRRGDNGSGVHCGGRRVAHRPDAPTVGPE